jgi:hypothetical protein
MLRQGFGDEDIVADFVSYKVKQAYGLINGSGLPADQAAGLLLE